MVDEPKPTRMEVAIHESGHALVTMTLGKSFEDICLPEDANAAILNTPGEFCPPLLPGGDPSPPLHRLMVAVAGHLAQSLFDERQRFNGVIAEDDRRQAKGWPIGPWPRVSWFFAHGHPVAKDSDLAEASRRADNLAEWRHNWYENRPDEKVRAQATMDEVYCAERQTEEIIIANWDALIRLAEALDERGRLTCEEAHALAPNIE